MHERFTPACISPPTTISAASGRAGTSRVRRSTFGYSLGGGRYGATLRTRLGSHERVLADERGVARLVDFK